MISRSDDITPKPPAATPLTDAEVRAIAEGRSTNPAPEQPMLTPDPAWRVLDSALLALLKRDDDGAKERNGSGFNREHSRWVVDTMHEDGTSIADGLRRGRPIPMNHRGEATKIAHTYSRTQLPAMGFPWADLIQQESFGAPAVRPTTTTETAADLLGRDIPPIVWTVRELLGDGMGILAGRPKQGKSWLGLQVAVAVATGTPIFSRPTTSGDVLYLALEDGPRRMKGRLRTVLHGRQSPSLLHIAFQWPRWDEGGSEGIADWLSAHPSARLVIIDTWGCIAPPPRSRGDSYADTYSVLSGLRTLAQHHRLSVILVTHARKSSPGGEEDFLDAVIGTTAITGVADTIWSLQRERGSEVATLCVTGRDVMETETVLGRTDAG